MSEIYKVFDNSGLTALTDHMKTTRTKADSNEAAIETLSADLVELSEEVVNALGNKQNVLTFDSTPTSGSTNPVTSTGIKTYVDENREQIVTATSFDGVTYTATVPGITELTSGVKFTMIPSMTSVAESIKLNVNGLGDRPLKARRLMNSSSSISGMSNEWLVGDYPITVMFNGNWWVTTDFGYAHASYLYGTVPIQSGGTGNVSFTTGSYLVGNGTSNLQEKTPAEVLTDIGAMPNTTVIPTSLSGLTDDANHRTVTDTEKATWNAKSTFSGNYNDLTNKPTIPAAVTVDSSLSSTSTNPVQNKVINSALSGKAPTSHASTATTYGKATSSNYGHVKLSDSTSSTSGTSGGIAATPAAVKAAYDLANSKSSFSGSYNDLTNKPTIPSAYTHPSTHAASMIAAGTFSATGVKAMTGTDYTTYRVRNAAIVSATPSSMSNGDVAFVYS